ncbi:MAG: hypothetical protein ABJF86_16990 [Tateyamaria sp.]|uniref:hypothetical protein n=1 Tax=Tateyamaria sp. TaxID=1929288 RepID=UPI003294520B
MTSKPFKPLSDLDWHRIANGDVYGPIEVGEIEYWLAVHIGAAVCKVQMNRPYIQKLRYKHNLDPKELAMMAGMMAVSHGPPISENNSRWTFLRYDEDMRRYYKLGLKMTDGGKELWICRFHRLSKNEYNRLLRKSLKK